MTDTTLLVISGPGVPPYSARGLTQTLNPIGAAEQLKRDVNGTLRDVSEPRFRKYESTISCEDQQGPAIGGWWQGMEVSVDCVARLRYQIGGSPEREVVEGSTLTEGDFISYRPRITFLIRKIDVSENEYGAIVHWSLALEEV